MVFWHISNHQWFPRVKFVQYHHILYSSNIWEILLYSRQLIVITPELIYGVRAAHRKGKIVAKQDYSVKWSLSIEPSIMLCYRKTPRTVNMFSYHKTCQLQILCFHILFKDVTQLNYIINSCPQRKGSSKSTSSCHIKQTACSTW